MPRRGFGKRGRPGTLLALAQSQAARKDPFSGQAGGPAVRGNRVGRFGSKCATGMGFSLAQLCPAAGGDWGRGTWGARDVWVQGRGGPRDAAHGPQGLETQTSSHSQCSAR